MTLEFNYGDVIMRIGDCVKYRVMGRNANYYLLDKWIVDEWRSGYYLYVQFAHEQYVLLETWNDQFDHHPY